MKLRCKLAALALGLSTIAAFAQTGNDTLRIKEEGKIEFNPHWYMQVQGGVSHTIGESKFGDLISPAVALYGGYQFTDLWGLRAGLGGWEARGAWAPSQDIYKYNFLQGNIDATLDLSNLFCGFNPKRVFGAYAFLGVGLNGAFNNDEAVAINDAGNTLQYLWRDSKFNVAGRGGLGMNLRLSDHVFFNLEVNANVLSDKYNSKKAGNADWQFNALAGFTIKFGKTYKKTEPVYYPPEPAPEPEPAPAPEPEPTPAPEPEPVPVEEPKVEPMQQNIFFLIDSSTIRASEQKKIDELIEFLKANPDVKVAVCGYADKQTGNYNINQRISERRAKAVAKALTDGGIAAERITVDHKGDTVQPFSSMRENRVVICITE